jgi:hypothetical protein
MKNVVLHLLVTVNIPSSLILFALMMGAIRSSENSVRTRVTRRGSHILHDHISL